MTRILTVATDQGIVVEDEVVIPDTLYLWWPAGTTAHFWYRHDGDLTLWSIDTGWGLGAAPGRTIAHVSTLGYYNWPSRLDYVFRDPVALKLYHVDILEGTTQLLITRDNEGNAINTEFQGKPFAHPNGSFYWTEGSSGVAARYVVRWSPTSDPVPRVLALVDINPGSGYQSGAEVFYRNYLCIPDGDPTSAHTIDYVSGDISNVSRSTSTFHNRFTEAIPTFAAAEADRWAATTSGGAYGYYAVETTARLRASFISSSHRVGVVGVSGGDADNAIDTGDLPHSAMHFNAARTAMTIYPYRGAGTGLSPYELKIFDPSQSSSSDINSNLNESTAIVQPLMAGDFTTSPHQVWPWGPVE